jgi:predicted RNase H-like HicB family nuclease
MSTPKESPPPDSSSVHLKRDGEWFVAIDEVTDVASQGKTRAEALANLAEAIELHEGGGEPIDDPDAFLREELDIDVDELDEQDPPWLE